MVGFIFGIIFILAGIGVGIGLCIPKKEVETKEILLNNDGNSCTNRYGAPIFKKIIVSPYKKFCALTIGIGVFLGCLSIFLGSISTVDTGNTGVITVFGRVEDKTLDAGFHMKAPWESVIQMNNKVQKATIDLQCFSSDIQEVEVRYTLNYQIKKSNAQEIYKTVGKDYYDTVITPNIAESVKIVTARYTAENLIGNRDELASNIEQFLSEQLDKYNIEVVSTAIEDMDFTDEFTAAVEAKQVAVQNKLKVQTEEEQRTMQAQKAAERAEIEAQASAAVAEIEARAAAAVAEIQANADKLVAEIGADSAEYQGKKEAAIALQRLASINGWTVVTGENNINRLVKADGTEVTSDELRIGTQKLIEYYYIQQWDGKLPETMLSDDANFLFNINN